MPENNARYYVDVDKTDDHGRNMGTSYNGQIRTPDDAVKYITESLNKCGDNLTCFNPFILGCIGEPLDGYIMDNMPESVGEEKTIEFAIKVRITIGKR